MESQIMEWSQGMGKRLKEYFRSRESRRRMTGEWDAAISVGATLFMVTVRNGRFLKEKEYILSGEGEASLAEALCRAEKDGFRHRKLLWLMNEPDLRCVCRKFPNMTEPELEETIQWEEDRLFGSEPVQSGYHILSYTPEGYEVLVSAIRKETGDRLAAAAEKAGPVSDTGGGQAMDSGAGRCIQGPGICCRCRKYLAVKAASPPGGYGTGAGGICCPCEVSSGRRQGVLFSAD